jgi:hypothetical protein
VIVHSRFWPDIKCKTVNPDWCRLPPTAVRIIRTTASARPLSCYIVDDVTRPNMVYTEYNLIILSYTDLAKYSDRYWLSMKTNSSQSCDKNWLVIYTDWYNPSRICRVRIVVWPKKIAPCILSHEVGPGCHDRTMFVPCWSYGGRYRHLTGRAGV